MPNPIVRSATLADMPAVLQIYAPIVQQTPVSFELEPPTLAEMEARFKKVTANHPYLVAECSQNVCGYAYAGTFRDRPAYDRTCELSVYVHPDFQGQGIGTLLYTALLQDLAQRGFTQAVAGTTLPNPASEKLHLSLGFIHVGTFTGVGHKFEKWWDVAFYQRSIAPTS